MLLPDDGTHVERAEHAPLVDGRMGALGGLNHDVLEEPLEIELLDHILVLLDELAFILGAAGLVPADDPRNGAVAEPGFPVQIGLSLLVGVFQQLLHFHAASLILVAHFFKLHYFIFNV